MLLIGDEWVKLRNAIFAELCLSILKLVFLLNQSCFCFRPLCLLLMRHSLTLKWPLMPSWPKLLHAPQNYLTLGENPGTVGVVYFDQRLGAGHSKCCSKSAFSCFSQMFARFWCCNNEKWGMLKQPVPNLLVLPLLVPLCKFFTIFLSENLFLPIFKGAKLVFLCRPAFGNEAQICLFFLIFCHFCIKIL